MRQSQRMLSNAVAVGTSQMLLLIPSLVLVPYLIGKVGDDGYGTYVLIWSLFMAIMQMQNSLQSGVVKYNAGFLAQGKLQKVNKIVSSSFLYSLIIAVLACLVILAIGTTYRPVDGGESVFIVVALLALFTIPFTPYVGIIQAKQRYEVDAFASTVARFAGLAAVILWFHFDGPSAQAAIIIMVSSLFASRLIQAPIAYRLVPGLVNNLRLFEWASFRLVFTFGTATVIASLCLAANSAGVRWLMGVMVSTAFVSRLAIMLMPGFVLTRMLGSVTNIVMPAASAYDAAGNHRMLGELLIRGMRYMTLMVIPAVVVAGLLMENVIVLWVGPDYAFLAPYAVIIFASRAVLQCTSVAHHVLKGVGKLRIVIITYAVGFVVVPLVLIWQINTYTNDPYLAVTTGLSTGYLVCAVWQLLACTHSVRVQLRHMITRAYIQPATIGVMILAFAGGLNLVVADGAFWIHLCIGLATFVLFSVMSYYLVLDEPERLEMLRLKNTVVRTVVPAHWRRGT